MSEVEKPRETWVYLGCRLMDSGRVTACWQALKNGKVTGKPLYYKQTKASRRAVIGGVYTIEVDLSSEFHTADFSTLVSLGQYAGSRADRLDWELLSEQTGMTVRTLSVEKKMRDNSLLMEALLPLRRMYAKSDRSNRAAIEAVVLKLLK